MYSVVVPQVSSSGTSDASNKSIASSSGGGGMGWLISGLGWLSGGLVVRFVASWLWVGCWMG